MVLCLVEPLFPNLSVYVSIFLISDFTLLSFSSTCCKYYFSQEHGLFSYLHLYNLKIIQSSKTFVMVRLKCFYRLMIKSSSDPFPSYYCCFGETVETLKWNIPVQWFGHWEMDADCLWCVVFLFVGGRVTLSPGPLYSESLSSSQTLLQWKDVLFKG